MPWRKEIYGREGVITSALRVLARDDTRVLTLTGLPGVGTTSVGRMLVAEQDAAQEIPFVDARLAIAPGVLSRLVFEALAVADLVLVDDADHASTARTELRHVLASQPHGRLLITSGAPLGLPGERVVRVPPLPEPDLDADLEEYADEPAIRLFLDAAERSGTTVTLQGDALRDVATLCAMLGGNPQAIVMAAARTVTVSPVTLLNQLASSAPSTVIARAAAADRDLFTAIAWSESLLDEAPRGLLAAMTVFRSAVPLDAIEAVTACPALIDSLAALVDTHLVEPIHETTGSRYRLTPLVREHAARLLDTDPGRLAELRTRHTEWAARVAVNAQALEGAGRVTAALTLVTTVEPDLLTALGRATKEGDACQATTLVLGLARSWFNRGPTPSELSCIEEVAVLSGAGAVPQGDIAMLKAWRGIVGVEMARDAEHVRVAMQHVRRAGEVAEQASGNLRVRVLMLTAESTPVLGDRSAMEPLCALGLELARELDDQFALTAFEGWAGLLACFRDDVDEAERWGRAGFERARRLDDPQVMLNSAGLLRLLPPGTPRGGELGGNATDGVPSYEQLLDIARRCGNMRAVWALLSPATILAVHSGDTGTAAAFGAEALRRARASDRPMRSLAPLMAVIILAHARGDRAVVRHLQEAVRPFQQVLLPMLPPWMARAYGDQIFDPQAEASSGSPTGQGALLDVHVATSVALDYVRSIALTPVIRLAPSLTDAEAAPPSPKELTMREWQVLRAMTSGASNKELSKHLNISTKTVMHHTSHIYRKLGVRGRSEAVAWALRDNRRPRPDGERVKGA